MFGRLSSFHTIARQSASTLRHGFTLRSARPTVGATITHFHSCSNLFAKKYSVQEWGLHSSELLPLDNNYIQPSGKEKTFIAMGASHGLVAFSGDGMVGVLGAGLNHSGQLGIGSTVDGMTFGAIDLSELSIKGLACGRQHSMILANTPTEDENDSGHGPSSSSSSSQTLLFGFGNSMYGQLGLGISKDTEIPKELQYDQSGLIFEPSPTAIELPDPTERIAQVVCGLDHTVIRTEVGNLYSMGWGADGQLGLGPDSSSDRALPTLIPALSPFGHNKSFLKGKVIDISCSTDFTLALMDNGQLWYWGNAEYGQCMVNQKIDRILEPIHIPHPIPKDEKISGIAAGGTFALLLSNQGKVYSCGYGAGLGLGKEFLQVLIPQRIEGLENVEKIVASTDSAAAITKDGELFTWGTCGETARLGHGDLENHYVPKKVKMPQEGEGKSRVIVHEVALGLDGGMAIIEQDV